MKKILLFITALLSTHAFALNENASDNAKEIAASRIAIFDNTTQIELNKFDIADNKANIETNKNDIKILEKREQSALKAISDELGDLEDVTVADNHAQVQKNKSRLNQINDIELPDIVDDIDTINHLIDNLPSVSGSVDPLSDIPGYDEAFLSDRTKANRVYFNRIWMHRHEVDEEDDFGATQTVSYRFLITEYLMSEPVTDPPTMYRTIVPIYVDVE